MSFIEILDEIPKLSPGERRELFLQVLSLEPEEDELSICDHGRWQASRSQPPS
jgi:hypothetical protein